MKFARARTASGIVPLAEGSDGNWHDISALVADIGPATMAEVMALRADQVDAAPALAGTPELDAPLARPGKLLCIGLNYTDHAAEANMASPAEPICFMKATSSIAGPFDALTLPPGSRKTDWEVELGIVIGTTARHVSEADALAHVAGYTVVNDVSERSYQLERGGQWTKGKSYDGFAPMGPWFVTADEVGDPQSLAIWLDVNGQRMQDGSTADMIFTVAKIVSYMSDFMTLEPGDVIPTGTPAGVGMGRGVFLKPGDVMEAGIDKLGTQKVTVAG